MATRSRRRGRGRGALPPGVTGSLDKYVQKVTPSSDKDPAAPGGPTQEPDQPDEVATPLQFADTEDISAKAPKRARRAPPGLYREASSSSESEGADDPVEEDEESDEYSFSS